MMQNTIQPLAEIEWRNGQPYASKFQDVYFSNDNGLLETEYVFLLGNDLLTRWQLPNIQNFIIAETGFGTGLNFLCAAKLWLENTPSNFTLHYISVEKYPLSLENITAALALWPELTILNQPFLTQYKSLLKDSKAILFNNRVQLSLLIGDATQCLSVIDEAVDAWFLDGFSPAKNPDIWQAPIFEQMARLSSTESTFSTFTSAGEVRRGLIKAGFKVSKRPGFGKKREMLIGQFLGNIKSLDSKNAP